MKEQILKYLGELREEMSLSPKILNMAKQQINELLDELEQEKRHKIQMLNSMI